MDLNSVRFKLITLSLFTIFTLLPFHVAGYYSTPNNQTNGLEDEVADLLVQGCCMSPNNTHIYWSGLPKKIDKNEYCRQAGQDTGLAAGPNLLNLTGIVYLYRAGAVFSADVMECVREGERDSIFYLLKSTDKECALLFNRGAITAYGNVPHNNAPYLVRKVCGLAKR